MFGPDGGLVANAPHIPVHLGAMQETVQFQVKYYKFSIYLFISLVYACKGLLLITFQFC